MKTPLVTALLALATTAAVADGASAQEMALPRAFSADIGLGVNVGPSYPGSDEAEAGPWLIWRNTRLGDAASGGARQGFAIAPSFGTVAPREASDDAALTGLDDIDRAYELGLKASYGIGAVDAYASLRKGFGGHDGLTGELGAKYRTDLSDRVTLWSGIELGYGNDSYNDTYFGVTPAESLTSGYGAYAPGGGFNSAAIKFEARYALTDSTALLGEVQYGKLIGDAADSPLVQDRYQPSLRLGIVRNFSFGF